MKEVYDIKIKQAIATEYGWINDKIYLDHAGSALYSSHQVQSAAKDLCTNLYGNPHSQNDVSKYTSDAIEEIRHRILRWYNAEPEDYSVVFTSSATAALKTVFESFPWTNKSSFVYTATNHTSVIGGRILAERAGAKSHCIPDDLVSYLFKMDAININYNYYCYDDDGDGIMSSLPSSSPPPPPCSLFAFPAQCNFSGKKFPLQWVDYIQKGFLSAAAFPKSHRWFCLLDTATFCATNPLDLKQVQPDFLCISFYKIFGFPTGLGALLIRNDTASSILQKSYFGGGTVDLSLPSGRFHRLRKNLHERFEDGTIPFLSIISLAHGFATFERIGLTMTMISRHVYSLAQETYLRMSQLNHWNGQPVAEIYSDFSTAVATTPMKQGGILAFNLKRANGSYIGYAEVLHIANLHKIQLRTGCFCNVGACQKFLKLTDDDLLTHLKVGHICGDDYDLINGQPTGAVRISFGLASSSSDVEQFFLIIEKCFVEAKPPCDLRNSSQINSNNNSNNNNNTLLGDDGYDIHRLEEICLYPVKSCAAFKVDAWPCTERGLRYDREWMIIDGDKGIGLTQKQEPLLCRIVPRVDQLDGTLTLHFTAAANNDCQITIKYNDCLHLFKTTTTKVCSDRVKVIDCGDAAADWLARSLNRPGLRLVRQLTNDDRSCTITKDTTSNKLSMVNQAQYLLINRASVDYLKRRLENVVSPNELNLDTLHDRFRGNFVVSGVKEFDEFTWKAFSLSGMEFIVDGFCTRCQIICIDQSTGEKNRKPLVQLSQALGGKLRFGIYCSNSYENNKLPFREHITRVGDEIKVLRAT